MHVTKVYFIQLVLKIKYVEFEDKPNNFYLKTQKVKVFFARRLTKELPTKKWKIRTLDDFLRKLQTTSFIERIAIIDLKCAVYMLRGFSLQGNVET